MWVNRRHAPPAQWLFRSSVNEWGGLQPIDCQKSREVLPLMCFRHYTFISYGRNELNTIRHSIKSIVLIQGSILIHGWNGVGGTGYIFSSLPNTLPYSPCFSHDHCFEMMADIRFRNTSVVCLEWPDVPVLWEQSPFCLEHLQEHWECSQESKRTEEWTSLSLDSPHSPPIIQCNTS